MQYLQRIGTRSAISFERRVSPHVAAAIARAQRITVTGSRATLTRTSLAGSAPREAGEPHAVALVVQG